MFLLPWSLLESSTQCSSRLPYRRLFGNNPETALWEVWVQWRDPENLNSETGERHCLLSSGAHGCGGVDLFPRHLLIPRKLLIQRWA
jgi:hypothetical protein